jgi:hypothetical protein
MAPLVYLENGTIRLFSASCRGGGGDEEGTDLPESIRKLFGGRGDGTLRTQHSGADPSLESHLPPIQAGLGCMGSCSWGLVRGVWAPSRLPWLCLRLLIPALREESQAGQEWADQ